MATEQQRGWKRLGGAKQKRKQFRVLTAAATRINVDNRVEVRRQRSVRMNWQLDAFTYRNTIGELRYAINFLANCSARMRLFVAALPDQADFSTTQTTSTEVQSDMPVDIAQLAGVPPEVIAACNQAMSDLGNGRTAIAGHMHSLSTNISIAGEGFLLGQEDPMTGQQTWSVRSVSEIVVQNDELMLREGPIDSTGQLGLIELNPDLTIVSRMWQPDPQFRLLADSPMRAILNECESLLILRRMIRATGRSRLAGRGLLLFPDELSITVNNDDNDDPDADPVMDSLADAMMTPITVEGDAGAVVPVLVRGPAEYLAAVRLVSMADNFDVEAKATRDELVGVIATGLDLPKEVITGVADLNHWSAWQVDDDTFRHHVEPHVITLVDCLTGAFLRPYFETCNVPSEMITEWMPRILFWYDPTELVTHPDQTANATLLHAALAISDAAYRRTLGFKEADAPTPQEIEVRMIRTMRNWPPNVVMALLHELDPELVVPAMTGPPALPGIDATGAVAPPAPIDPTTGLPTPTTPALPDATTTEPAKPVLGVPPTTPTIGPPTTEQPSNLTAEDAAFVTQFMQRAIEATLEQREHFVSLLKARMSEFSLPERYEVNQLALTASAKPKPSEKSVRLSNRLTNIDTDLRLRVTTAANAALLRQLEKAGSRLRQKVANQSNLRDKIANTRAEHIMMKLGQTQVEATGLTASVLMNSDWEQFKEQWFNWTATAQAQAIKTAAELGGVTPEDAEAQVSAAMASGAQKGWELLTAAMDTLAVHAAYNPDPTITNEAAVLSMNPDTLIPTGVVRAALALAGGGTEQDFGLVTTVTGATVPAVALGVPVGGIGTGVTIGGLLTGSGAITDSYTWQHGVAKDPFDPHLALDNVTFTSFTDPALANDGSFPQNQFFMPGDHQGCSCDFSVNWISQDDVDAAQAALANSDDE